MLPISSHRPSAAPAQAAPAPKAVAPTQVNAGIDKLAAIRERITQIKQLIEQLRQMLASLGGPAAKSVLRQIGQLAAELGQLASALKAAGDSGSSAAPAAPFAPASEPPADEGRAAYAEQQQAAETDTLPAESGASSTPSKQSVQGDLDDIEELRKALHWLKKQAERVLEQEKRVQPE